MGSCVKPQGLIKKQNKGQQEEKISNLEFITKGSVRGINVVINKVTGQWQGVPEQWKDQVGKKHKVNQQKVINTNHLPQEIRPGKFLPTEIVNFMKKQQKQHCIITSTMIQSSLLSDQRISFQLSNSEGNLEKTQLMSIISNFSEIKESSVRIGMLSEDQFKAKKASVVFVNQNPGIKYNFLKLIGGGSNCKVYLAKSIIVQELYFAVRIIKMKDTQTLEKIRGEIAVMQMLPAENIIKYHFSYYFEKTFFMFVQYMEYGSLANFIKKYAKKRQIPFNLMAYILREILKGLSILHQKRQIHRDIKSDNVLINKKGHVKISDFGYTLQLTKENTFCQGLSGTPAWMAPQLINLKQYDEAVDIWSLGIVSLQLLEGQPRHLCQKPYVAMYRILKDPAPQAQGATPQFASFISKCLVKEPNKRAKARELLNHPFIKSVGNGIMEKELFLKMLQDVSES